MTDDNKYMLIANPHYYDYIHRIELDLGKDIEQEEVECKFLDGAGQCMHLDITGTYRDYPPDSNTETEAIGESHVEERGSIKFNIGGKTFEIKYRIENGRWLMRKEVVWRQPKETWPILIATNRWVFDTDPISAFYNNRECNLYYMVGDGTVNGDKSEKIYYDHNYITYSVPLNTLSEEDQKLVPTFPEPTSESDTSE